MKKNSGSTLAVVSVIVALVIILGVGSIAYVQMQTKRSQSNQDNVESYQQSNEEKQLAAFEMKKATSYTIEGNERDSYYKFFPILLSSSHEYFDSNITTGISDFSDYYSSVGWETSNGVPKYATTKLLIYSPQNASSIGGYYISKITKMSGSTGTNIATSTLPLALPGPEYPEWSKNFETYYGIQYIYPANSSWVTWQGRLYICIQSHTTNTDTLWGPNYTPALWEDRGPAPAGGGGGATYNLEFTKYVKIPAKTVLGISFGEKYYKYVFSETVVTSNSGNTYSNPQLIVTKIKAVDVPNINLTLIFPTTTEESVNVGTNDYFTLWAHIQATDTLLTRSYSDIVNNSTLSVNSNLSLSATAINNAKQEVSALPSQIKTNVSTLHGTLADIHNASDISINSIKTDTANLALNPKILLNSIRVASEEYKVQLLILAQLYATTGVDDSTKASLNLVAVRANRALNILYSSTDTNAMETVIYHYVNATNDTERGQDKAKLLASAAQLKLINTAIAAEMGSIQNPVIQATVDRYKTFFNSGTTIEEGSGSSLTNVVTKGTMLLGNDLYSQISQLPVTAIASSGSGVVIPEVPAPVGYVPPVTIANDGRIYVSGSVNMSAGSFVNTLQKNGESVLPSITVFNGATQLYRIQPGETKVTGLSTGSQILFQGDLTYAGGTAGTIISLSWFENTKVRVTITSSEGTITGSASFVLTFSQ